MGDIAEKSVIGALLMDAQSVTKVYDILEPYMFRNELRGRIYKEIIKAYDIGAPVNLVTLMQSLEAQQIPREITGREVKCCMDDTLTSAGIVSYAEDIVKDYKAHRLKETLSRLDITPADVEQQISELIHDLELMQKNEKNGSKRLSEIVGEYQGLYFKERSSQKLHTGFSRLDDITGGLERGDVIVIGARPAVGKSAFVTQIILQMAAEGGRVAFYNLEMSDKQIYERLLSNQSGIQLNRIRRSMNFLNDEQNRYERANKTLEKLDIMISSGTKSVAEIRNECRHQELDCIIIDYLQLVKSDVRYQNRVSEVGAISKSIKALAMELNLPVIALSQLNRASEMKNNREPTMGELREAGDIEQDASIIILMWNPDAKDNSKKALKVDKNRQGERGQILYRFEGNQMRFIETDEKTEQDSDGFHQTGQRTPFD